MDKRHLGTHGNIGRKDNGEGYRALLRSNKGYYKVAFVDSYEYLSERDIELRQEYAKDAIGRYEGVGKKMLTFRKKSTEDGAIFTDEVYYVKIGNRTVGKVSIRVTRLFKNVNLSIIYQQRNISHKSQNKKTRRWKN